MTETLFNCIDCIPLGRRQTSDHFCLLVVVQTWPGHRYHTWWILRRGKSPWRRSDQLHWWSWGVHRRRIWRCSCHGCAWCQWNSQWEFGSCHALYPLQQLADLALQKNYYYFFSIGVKLSLDQHFHFPTFPELPEISNVILVRWGVGSSSSRVTLVSRRESPGRRG